MNDTIRLYPDVAEFAASVRSQLSDLDADELEELTGDLEADLQERVDDAGYVDLGDPAAYATELRSAAGLPPRPVPVKGVRGRLRDRGSATAQRWRDFVDRLRERPGTSAVLDFLVALRPAWWILRAWVAYQIAHVLFAPNSPGNVLPHSLRGWAILAAATIVSVQWGRGRWRDRRWVPALVVAGSVTAVVGPPFAYDHASAEPESRWSTPSMRPMAHHPDNGLRMNGQPVRNVFAYDAKGNPLADVQLYDQSGDPLFVTRRQSLNWVSVPATLRTGQQAWNVYPLARVRWRDSKFDRAIGDRVAEPGVVPQVWALPMPHAPALMSTPTDGDGGAGEPAKEDKTVQGEKQKSTNDASEMRH
ncbi:hypothetical protein [Solicola gregarius]|uniref:Uncharacterized protein n=1 Tax=Solicola gregarius TaxID=2908642 RepID=A0AA46TJ81_9ACTN|nr:hypothetical protein [Solicola gregarius]UYM06123.1 hypothetical protein L0C25_03355 [Solicola gregarius]